MKKIASFTVDHLRLLRGVYVSRRDTTPSGDVTPSTIRPPKTDGPLGLALCPGMAVCSRSRASARL